MVIFTAKLSKPKLAAILAAAAGVIVLIVLLANRGQAAPLQEAMGRAPKLETPEQQLAFLAEQGYEAGPEAQSIREVRIPQEWSEVYEAYNAMQKAQGLDLSKYRGKTVLQVVYPVSNYPEENGDPVYATLLLYKNRLVGADLSRGGADSFLRPLLGA